MLSGVCIWILMLLGFIMWSRVCFILVYLFGDCCFLIIKVVKGVWILFCVIWYLVNFKFNLVCVNFCLVFFKFVFIFFNLFLDVFWLVWRFLYFVSCLVNSLICDCYLVIFEVFWLWVIFKWVLLILIKGFFVFIILFIFVI